MKTTTRQLTLCAMLTALALALSWVERFLPLSLLIPLPGIKLGLANIVTLFALYALGPAQALLILLCRCTLGALFAGNLNQLLCDQRSCKRSTKQILILVSCICLYTWKDVLITEFINDIQNVELLSS